MGFLEIVFVVLLVLKLTHNADISWLVVFLPLVVGAVVNVLALVIFFNVRRRF